MAPKTQTVSHHDLRRLIRDGRLLGSGLTGKAFLVRQENGKKAVLKVCEDPSFDFVFKNESRVLRKLRRSGVVPQVFGVSLKPSAILMEYCEGPTGQQLLDGKVTGNEALMQMVKQLAHQVGELHKQGFAHNDIKLDNVIVDTTSKPLTVRLIDFGHCMPIGLKPGYDVDPEGLHLAPELCRRGQATSEADVFSLGFTLRQILKEVGSSFFPKILGRLADQACSEDPKLRPSIGLFKEAMTIGIEKIRKGFNPR